MKSCFFNICAIVLIALGVCAVVFAQEMPQQECPLCVCVTDGSCSEIGNCSADNQTGCESTQFTPECSGTYKFDVTLACADCEHCLACAYLFVNGSYVTNRQAGCMAGQCYASDYVNLTRNVTYTLYACLRGCGTGDCNAHCSGCTAKARVYRVLSDCGMACNW
jgi:hypothetical protein